VFGDRIRLVSVCIAIAIFNSFVLSDLDILFLFLYIIYLFVRASMACQILSERGAKAPSLVAISRPFQSTRPKLSERGAEGAEPCGHFTSFPKHTSKIK
jgi:hypothetical protein